MTQKHVERVRGYLKEDGVLADDPNENAPLKLQHSRLKELWGTYCLIWKPEGETAPHTKVLCSCWQFVWKGKCEHYFACQEYWTIHEWAGPLLPMADADGPPVEGMDSENEAPARLR